MADYPVDTKKKDESYPLGFMIIPLLPIPIYKTPNIQNPPEDEKKEKDDSSHG